MAIVSVCANSVKMKEWSAIKFDSNRWNATSHGRTTVNIAPLLKDISGLDPYLRQLYLNWRTQYGDCESPSEAAGC